MSAHQYTGLFTVTATGDTRAQAAEYARGELDDTLARLDQAHPAGSLATGPVTLIDPLHLLQTLTAIRNDAAALADRSALTVTAPAARIRDRVDALIGQLRAAPALEG